MVYEFHCVYFNNPARLRRSRPTALLYCGDQATALLDLDSTSSLPAQFRSSSLQSRLIRTQDLAYFREFVDLGFYGVDLGFCFRELEFVDPEFEDDEANFDFDFCYPVFILNFRPSLDFYFSLRTRAWAVNTSIL